MTAGNSTILIDTNVLVYAHDPRDRRKQERALAVLDRLINQGRVALSVQCLSEFFNTTTRRLSSKGAGEHSLSIWDALIWATAKLNQVPLVLSEDFVDGGFLEGGRFLNPFTPAFDLALLDVGS